MTNKNKRIMSEEEITQYKEYCKANGEGLWIYSTNMASYITTITGIEAHILCQYSKSTGRFTGIYLFANHPEVHNAFNYYKAKVNDNLELPVDLSQFIRNFSMYKKSSKSAVRDAEYKLKRKLITDPENECLMYRLKK